MEEISVSPKNNKSNRCLPHCMSLSSSSSSLTNNKGQEDLMCFYFRFQIKLTNHIHQRWSQQRRRTSTRIRRDRRRSHHMVPFSSLDGIQRRSRSNRTFIFLLEEGGGGVVICSSLAHHLPRSDKIATTGPHMWRRIRRHSLPSCARRVCGI